MKIRKKNSPTFRRIFHQSFEIDKPKISPELRSGELQPQHMKIERFFAKGGFQGKTPWIDRACADSPGFLVAGAADAWLPTFVQEPRSVVLG